MSKRMGINAVFPFFLIFGLSFTLSAQDTHISRVILDSKTSNPVAFANVTIVGSGKGTYSDEFGRFSLNFSMSDSLIFSSIGYQPKAIMGGAISQKVLLTPAVVELNEIEIKPRQGKFLWVGNLGEKRTGHFSNLKDVAVYIPNTSDNNVLIRKVVAKLSKVRFDNINEKKRLENKVILVRLRLPLVIAYL
jgi:hypothetical protein